MARTNSLLDAMYASAYAVKVLQQIPMTPGPWFHAGHLEDGIISEPEPEQFGFAFFHVGTRDAALERIAPTGAPLGTDTGSSIEEWNRTARLYLIEVDASATICPHEHYDDWADEDNADGMNVGNEYFDGHACGGTGAHGQPGYDVHPYANGYEDAGSLSLAVRPSMVRVIADLGPHPAWTSLPSSA